MTSVGFAEVARQLNRTAASLGLTTPAFRSPPRKRGVARTIVRRPDGSATVSVALRGRPGVAVVADMIDGVLAANASGPDRSVAVRDRLWSAAAPALFPVGSLAGPAPVGSRRAGRRQGDRRTAGSPGPAPSRSIERPAA